ncbi:MAG: hypothetical protein PQJ59_16505 [Spirochaetales bacterium]|nr:hypothetical protein [Spirochaetales bacterium]
MPVGITENSPVQLSLTRSNFNSLINRHSQPIRWLTAEKCPCIGSNQRPDANCSFCKGKGVSYDITTECSQIETLRAVADGVIEQDNVVWVRDLKGNEYSFTDGGCITYVPDAKRGFSYNVKYTEDITLSGSGTATKIDTGLYSVDLPEQVKFGYVQGELLTVEAESNGATLTVTDIFRNSFEISEDISTDVTVTYTYVEPFQFALITNNFSRTDQKYLDAINGQGMLIFPQRWEVTQDDLIVALNATETKKIVYRSTGNIDTLPSFYLYELKQAFCIRDGAKVEFTPYTDFTIYKGNEIQWISDNKPEEDEQVSITYIYNTVYRVVGDIPDPRTSENNRFPRKVALKLYTDFNKRENI